MKKRVLIKKEAVDLYDEIRNGSDYYASLRSSHPIIAGSETHVFIGEQSAIFEFSVYEEVS